MVCSSSNYHLKLLTFDLYSLSLSFIHSLVMGMENAFNIVSGDWDQELFYLLVLYGSSHQWNIHYCEKREKGESLIFVIEKLLIIHIGLGYIYTC